MDIINVKIYTANEEFQIIENGFCRIIDDKITDVSDMSRYIRNNDSEVIDAEGAMLFPGFIDAHSHVGMWEDAISFEGDDGNEMTNPSTPQLRAIDAINSFDKCFIEALEAGITTVITGPGSANPVAGQMAAVKTYETRIDKAIIKAPVAIKFALGENPKRVYNSKDQTPMTRMASASIIREQLIKAKQYKEELDDSKQNPEHHKPPKYDFKCEALIPLLKGEIEAHIHAHRSDDIYTAIRLAKEFDLKFTVIHCTEGHLIADELVNDGVKAVIGPTLTDRSKPELKNLTTSAAGILEKAGVRFAICTDHPVIPIQYLPLCAGLAVREGMSYDNAIKAITSEPAKICRIYDKVGSIEKGKTADLALFDCDPLSNYAKPKAVIAGGKCIYNKI